MGQATRNIKTAADSSRLSLGAAVANAARRVGQNATRAARLPVAPIQASLPIPDPSVKFIGYQPAGPPKDPKNDLKKIVGGIYDQIHGAAAGIGNIATGDAWRTDPKNKASDRLLETLTTDNMGAKRNLKGRKVDQPQDSVLSDVEAKIESALRDGTWSPDERADIVKQYRDWWSHYTTGGQDAVKNINNWAVQSEYKRLVQQWHSKTVNADSKNKADTRGDLWTSYSGTLASEGDDDFGPGFVLSQDEDGFYMIQNLQDLQHQIETTMRRDPRAAGAMIQRLAAWGAYGAGTDKYAADRLVVDKNGRPVKGHWTVDDAGALKTFLKDVAKVQETALSAGELQPWDTVLDQVSAQQAEVGTSKGYGAAGGGGGRGYGGGGFGGGGGGGVSYTDADQLKQLINSVARARMGTALNDDQINQFVQYYHQKEAEFVKNRVAGLDGQQLDPESQAAAWIENHFRDQMAAQQGNVYVSALANFLMGGSFGSQSS